MRPCGGFGPDMMDYANSTDVYKIWADMIAFDRSTKSEGAHAFCAYVGRRDGKQYQLSHEEILSRYGDAVRMSGRLPDALSVAMGNQFYMATFPKWRRSMHFLPQSRHWYKNIFICINKKRRERRLFSDTAFLLFIRKFI